jgi:hypothetical protein
MNKHITIEWPYDEITLNFEQLNKTRILSHEQWVMLERAEKPLYDGQHGTHAYTSVNVRGESLMAALIWQHCEDSMSANDDSTDQHEVAHRVARVLAIMAFGPEFILK